MQNVIEDENVSYPIYDTQVNEFNLSKLNEYTSKENPSFNDLQVLLSELKPLEIKEL